jgi:hypothetical protein
MQLSEPQIANLVKWIEDHKITCPACNQRINWKARFVYGLGDYIAPNEIQITRGDAPTMLELSCDYCNGIMLLRGEEVRRAIPFPS